MTRGKDLGSRNMGSGARNLKELMARTILKDVHNKGHPYVEIREDGKRFIFFCTLCLAPCFSDSTLQDHLKGNIHSHRCATAQATLFGPLPWPFSDGVLFFHTSPGENCQHKLLEWEPKSLKQTTSGEQSDGNLDKSDHENLHVPDEHEKRLLVPQVLVNNVKSVLEADFIGSGQIGLRINETSSKISRIWCAYFGNVDSDDKSTPLVPNSDFAIITFSYKYELGRFNLVDGLLQLGQTDDPAETNAGAKARKKPKLLTATETAMESLEDDSDCFTGVNNSTETRIISHDDWASNSSLAVKRSDELVLPKFISKKAMRKEVRKQQRVAAERMCDICQQKMLPGKDVATLFNIRTGKLACSSRNTNGVFHVFHVSCLIHWILLSMYEMWTDQSTNPIEMTNGKPKRKRRAKSSKSPKIEKENKKTDIVSLICPECQGSGIDREEEDELEVPVIPLSKMYLYKVKANEAHREWMKSPEILTKCCIGLHFPPTADEKHQEKVSTLKSLQFYRAKE